MSLTVMPLPRSVSTSLPPSEAWLPWALGSTTPCAETWWPSLAGGAGELSQTEIRDLEGLFKHRLIPHLPRVCWSDLQRVAHALFT